MKNIRLSVVVLLIFILSGLGYAQKTRPAGTVFTSVYTSLSSGCKEFKGENGSDGASICRGPGGYQTRVYYAAAAYIINAEKKNTDDSYPLCMLALDFDDRKTRLEWRLANGKPFAVIMRVPKYSETVADGEYFGKVIGQELIIRGLKGVEIQSSVDAKAADANVRAREIADKAFIESLKK